MSEEQSQKITYSPQGGSQGGFGQSSQSPVQYDWVDMVRQQNSRLVENEDRQKQLQKVRRQKYREILEQEINEREVKKNYTKEAKKQEHEEIEKNLQIIDKYDQEKKNQKKLIERQIQEQNKQLISEKKQAEKESKNRSIEQTLNSYTINNLNMQKQIDDENQLKIQRQREFLNSLENQKKQNQDLKSVQRISIAQDEQNYLNHLSGEEQQRINERDRIKYSYQSEKPTVFQQIDQAYKEKEQKMQNFEHQYVNDGLQQQLQRERQMQDLMKQGKKQLQSQVNQIVGNQLEQKKLVQVYQNNNKNEERNLIDQNFINYKSVEQQRKQDQRELYQRQNYINQQQVSKYNQNEFYQNYQKQQLKGQLKERQRHMNENEIKINLDKYPETPINLPNSSSTIFGPGKIGQFGGQTKANHIYLGDYVSYDRQKQLQYVDMDLLEKMPAQQEQYKRTVQNQSLASIPQDPSFSQFPQSQSPDQQSKQQEISHRSNNKYDLYLQQTKFPRNNAFTNNKSPPLFISTSPQNQIENRLKQYENGQQQFTQPYNYPQQFRHQSSPQALDQQNLQYKQQQLDYQQINQNIPHQKPQQENMYYPQQQIQQNSQVNNKPIVPLSGVSNTINLENNQKQQQQQNNRSSQHQIQVQNQKDQRSQQNPIYDQVQNAPQQNQQVVSPNKFYDKFNYNIQTNNSQNIPPPAMQAPFKSVAQVPIGNMSIEQYPKRANKEFNIKSVQYNNTNVDPNPQPSNQRLPTENQIRVYRSPQNIQNFNNNQQNYNIPQMNRYQSQSNQSLNGNTVNNNSNYRVGVNSNMSNSMNFIESRSNILSAQKQDYNQIRQNNANWAQRGFNIITGGN